MTYEEATAALGAIASGESADARLNPDCRSQSFLHGVQTDHALLLWHGFTNSPRQFVPLAELFFRAGFNVYVPLLPYHGRRERLTPALAQLRPGDLERAAAEALQIANGLGRRVHALGLSLGGILAAYLGQTAPLGTAMAISPSFALPFLPRFANVWLLKLLQFLPNRWMWWDPRAKANAPPPHAYPRYPTRALAAVLAFGEEVFRAAAGAAPGAQNSILVTNRKEPAVNNDVTRGLWQTWLRSGATVQTFEFDDLDLRHDIIDPTTYPDAERLVYPVLVDLMRRSTGMRSV